MEIYSQKSSNKLPQIFLVLVQLACILVTVRLLINRWDHYPGPQTIRLSLLTLLAMNVATLVRFFFTLFVFIKRKIPLEEIISVSFAFALYYVGFFVLTLRKSNGSVPLIGVGIILFIIGSLFNVVSEFQRMKWKKHPENKGKIFTEGLFGMSRHPNYFGDFLWVSGYAVVSGNIWSLTIPLLLFFFFLFANIPMQEKHMLEKYGDDYAVYSRKVKSFIPYII